MHSRCDAGTRLKGTPLSKCRIVAGILEAPYSWVAAVGAVDAGAGDRKCRTPNGEPRRVRVT